METLKKVINILAMVYLVIVFLFLLHILSVSKFVALFDLSTDAVFYNRLLWTGAILLLAELVVENAYIANLKRGLERENRQIMELKAQLYDQRMKENTAAPLAPEPRIDRTPDAPAVTKPMWPTSPENQRPEPGPVITPTPTHPPSNPVIDPNHPPHPDQRPLR